MYHENTRVGAKEVTPTMVLFTEQKKTKAGKGNGMAALQITSRGQYDHVCVLQ